jgi:quercetin dioxygenase-like cupin family protein
MKVVEPVKVVRWEDLSAEVVLSGVHRQRVDAERMTVVRYVYAPGSVFPAHSHPEEQVTIVLSGEVEFDVAGATVRAGAGSVILIPPEVVHGARVLGDLKVETLNALSPRRIQEVTG